MEEKVFMCRHRSMDTLCFIRILYLSILIVCLSECTAAQSKSSHPRKEEKSREKGPEEKDSRENGAKENRSKEEDTAPGDSSTTIIEEVKDFSKKDNFFSRILKRVIVSDEDEEVRKAPPDPDLKKAAASRGKIIRHITIEPVDVFGASVNNPADTARNWLQRAGNSLHSNTKDWVIMNNIIIAPGQKFNPFYVQESERIIRQNSFIYDVRIVPLRIKNNEDSVDVVVYVQDIWSIKGSAGYSPGNKDGKLFVNDLNFLGHGNEFKGGIKLGRDLSQGWDWEGSYTFNNIEMTHTSAKLFYSNDRFTQEYGIGAGRDFYSPVVNWAGAIAQTWKNVIYPEFRNSRQIIETVRFNQQDYWLGYAFDTEPFNPDEVNQNRLNIAGRITRTVYNQTPELDTLNIFRDNTFYLGRLGYSYRTYYQDRFIFGLGRTEDIPLINMVELLVGIEKGPDENLNYYGIKSGYSFVNSNGYFYGGLQAGAFKGRERWMRRTYMLDLLYFSKLQAIGNYQWRHYIQGRYSYSYNPLWLRDELNIQNSRGIRGFSEGSLRGNKKMVLNYEANIFVPLQLLGFKLAVITFADFGLLAPGNKLIFDSKLYQGYGLGFRIRNEHLIFPEFQFMFAYYPNTPDSGGKHFNMFPQNSIFYQFNQFQFSTPEIITAE